MSSVGTPLEVRELRALLERVHSALEARRAVIDELNVFPIPDGDTGTNMTLTIRSALEVAGDDDDFARSVLQAVVRGARGNSGVILSQVVRALVEQMLHGPLDAAGYAAALDRARTLAYEAIANPVEGTMLTAISAAADAAAAATSGDGAFESDLPSTSAQVCAATADAVARTPEQLDVLRQAGVVDAGARGLEVVLAAVHGHLTGRMPRVDEDRPPARADTTNCFSSSGAFEVQYLLEADESVAEPLRAQLERLGDSVAVVAAGGVLNVHVHTDAVGPAIEAGLEHGRASDIDVVHFGEQIAARARRHRASCAVVAVIEGEQLGALAREVGAVVVDGSGTNLPSVADLLEAVDRAHADEVVMLPGHRNAVAAARQAAGIALAESATQAHVVPAADSPPAVLAALAVFDPAVDLAETLDEMSVAAKGVRAGEIVDAVRGAQTPAGPIRRGQPMAVLADGTVVGADTDLEQLVTVLCTALHADDAEVVTVLTGDDPSIAEVVVAAIGGLAPDAQVETIAAAVAPARCWIGVE